MGLSDRYVSRRQLDEGRRDYGKTFVLTVETEKHARRHMCTSARITTQRVPASRLERVSSS